VLFKFGPTGEENPKVREEKLVQKAFLKFFLKTTDFFQIYRRPRLPLVCPKAVHEQELDVQVVDVPY
jgi:hypothetical protein